MPAYDYRCNACSRVFEKTQRITEPAGADCPECGASDCTRMITGGTFHLKGAGWYASDYGTKPAPVAAPPASSAAPEPAACGAQPDGTCAKVGCAAAAADA